jgi:hypothetical protein
VEISRDEFANREMNLQSVRIKFAKLEFRAINRAGFAEREMNYANYAARAGGATCLSVAQPCLAYPFDQEQEAEHPP